MEEVVRIFCEDEEIQTPTVISVPLEKGVQGMYLSKERLHECSLPFVPGFSGLVVVDIEQAQDWVKTLFHELFHHWQHEKLGQWADARNIWLKYGSHLSRVEWEYMYLNSDIEVEARSFARSIVEDLDQS